MRKTPRWLCAGLLALLMRAAWAAPLEISLAADRSNPAAPRMGDRMRFSSVIRITGSAPARGWPMRLIQAGDYRVVISAVERGAPHVITSSFADFHVERKPVVESQRILPVAFGVPLLLAGLLFVRRRRDRPVRVPTSSR